MYGCESAMNTGEPKPESDASFALGALLYRLTVVFPSWAGAFLALYAISTGQAALRVRFR
jgi:hypothetical protein